MPQERLINRGVCVIAVFIALFPICLRAGIIGGPVSAGGYTFTNFDGPNNGTAAGAGTNANGIANNGAAVGFSIDNAGNLTDFIFNPNGSLTTLSIGGFQPMAFGIDTAGDIVGARTGAAFFMPHGGVAVTLANPATATSAFGINDHGNIVGQYNSGAATPGFYLASSAGNGLVTINAPSGPNVVNAQGVNDNGLLVGFYLGTDGQVHGFMGNVANAVAGNLTGTAIADPTIPSVPGEPGATFVFSQILGVNDAGIAVGYYGDSTTSQHGFFYNTHTGVYTFLDDPSEQFSNGVEVTQITGIDNVGAITGFYSDAGGVFHGFVACAGGLPCSSASSVPEPGSVVFASVGLTALAFFCLRRKRHSLRARR